MKFPVLTNLFRLRTRQAKHRRPAAPVQRQLTLETLEDRLVPSTLYVNHSGAFMGHAAFTTITAAVAGARSRDIIEVGPGDYSAEGAILLPSTKIGLELKGAQGEKDPATASHGGRVPGDPATESVVQAFKLQGSKQQISGFTITNPALLGTGITTDPGHSGYKIVYNIFTNIGGVAVEFNSAGTYHSQVEYNWFDSTSAVAGLLGPIGQDIDTTKGPLSNAGIGKNWFAGQTTDTTSYSVVIEGVSSSLPDHRINIVKNTFEGAGNLSQGSLRVSNAIDVNVDKNTITDYVGNGIDLADFLDGVRVRGSNLDAGGEGAHDAIVATAVFGPTASRHHVRIVGNDISGGLGALAGGFGGNGIDVEELFNPSTGFSKARFDVSDNHINHVQLGGIKLDGVEDSILEKNHSDDNGSDGIQIEVSSGNTLADNTTRHDGYDGIEVDSGSVGNTSTLNKSLDNGHFDFEDSSAGAGTARTGNTWSHNEGATVNPGGL
jgi:parallel beta-helix repeat protein